MKQLLKDACRRGWRGSVLVMLFTAAACSQKLGRPSAAPVGDEAPVALRNIQMANVDGHRAVLLHLSRLPTLVRHASKSNPAQIIIQAWGPNDEDMPERVLPGLDVLISQVRVSRRAGGLNVVLELAGNEPPPYTVHEMADWIMVRFAGPEKEG